MNIDLACHDDIPELLEGAREFVEESAWPVTFDAEASRLRFEGLIDSEHADVIVARDGGIIGGAIVAIDRDFTAEWWGYLVKFYIRREHRRADVALPLMRFCVRWFDHMGCHLAFATATSGIPGGFEIMMRRVGFKPCGPTFVKEFA